MPAQLRSGATVRLVVTVSGSRAQSNVTTLAVAADSNAEELACALGASAEAAMISLAFPLARPRSTEVSLRIRYRCSAHRHVHEAAWKQLFAPSTDYTTVRDVVERVAGKSLRALREEHSQRVVWAREPVA